VLVLWRQDNTLFSPPRHTDPWFYLGFFRTLVNFKRDLLPGTYYGSRLAWILPGYLVHSIFPPLIANGVLHLGVHSIATLSFFSILQMTAGARSAFLATMVFAVHPWLWCATGWDYINGAGIAWCLLALALLTWAARKAAPRWSLVLAGVALAGMVHSTFFLLAFTPLPALYYIGMARAASLQKSVVRPAVTFCLWAGAGFVLLTALLSGVNYLLDGQLWFWASSFRAAKDLLNPSRWAQSGIWEAGRLASWLWFPAVSIIAAIVLLPSRLRQEWRGANAAAVLLTLDLLLAAGFMAYQQQHGIQALGQYFYASYLLPFVFLVAGISFWPAADKMSLRTFVLTCAAGAAIFAALWADPSSNFVTRSPAGNRAMVFLAAAALALALLLRHRAAGAFLALAGFAILTAETGAASPSLHGNSALYERVLNARDRVEHFRRGGVVRFWFDERDPANLDYFALSNTYLAERNQIGTSFPRDGCSGQIDPGALIVVSSRMTDAAEAARRTLADCWRAAGIRPAILAVDAMKSGRQPYAMILLRAEADPLIRHPLHAVFDSAGKASLQFLEHAPAPLPFPRERWTLTPHPADPAEMQNTSRGVVVRTPRSAYGFTLEFPPLAIPVTGRYCFTLRYRPISGQIAFGARPADDSRYLGADSVGHPIDGEREMDFWLDLNRGESILLRIANNNNFGDGAASFVIGDVTAAEVGPRRE
jgi:hypothetical protein